MFQWLHLLFLMSSLLCSFGCNALYLDSFINLNPFESRHEALVSSCLQKSHHFIGLALDPISWILAC